MGGNGQLGSPAPSVFSEFPAALLEGNRATGKIGIGGGIYELGTLTPSASAKVAGNFASTADPNVFP